MSYQSCPHCNGSGCQGYEGIPCPVCHGKMIIDEHTGQPPISEQVKKGAERLGLSHPLDVQKELDRLFKKRNQ